MNIENINKFEELLKSTKREGIDDLINFVRKSNFYVDPASTKYHSCHEGGLLEHSLNVYDRLSKHMDDDTWAEKTGATKENIIIVALLHDLCKANTYSIDYRNKKVYSETGKKSDNKGNFEWESVPFYTVEDNEPYGHGEKSVMLIEKFINLEPVEMYAIRWHMAFTLPKEEINTLSSAIRKYPLILATSIADLEATYLLEKEE